MAPGKSPAFSFYAKDWLAATLTWTLDARGAYVTLLAYQWDAGFVPAGNDQLARVLGVSVIKARSLWVVIGHKFELGTDHQWRNPRLEQERQKQDNRRAALADNGSKGGRPKNQQVKQNETNSFSKTEPNENLNESLSSSSPSSFASSGSAKERQNGASAAPLIVSPMAYERRKTQCVYVGARLEVPHGLHFDLRKLLGGANAETDLLAWYADLDEEIEGSGEKIAPDVFKWLKVRYAKWATRAVDPSKAEAEMVAFLEADMAERKGRVS